MEIVVNLLIVALIAGLTWALMSEGLWGAALMFFNILFSALIAFNFHEPLAALLAENVEPISGYADTLVLCLLFLITLVLMRVITESVAPGMVRFPTPVFHLGRVFFGLAGAVSAVAFMLVVYHTAPVHKRMFQVIDYSTKPPFKMGLDHAFLAFFQYTTGQVFATYGNDQDPAGEYGTAKVFDARGRWLIDHEAARPYGRGRLDRYREEVEANAGAAAPAGGGGAGGGGGQANAGGQPNNAPIVPGGNAGAAVGLAPLPN